MFISKFFCFAVVVAFAMLATGGEAAPDQKAAKLKFSFYITSLCSDTRRFITTQLYPTYQELKDYLEVEFILWAKAKRENDTITCQFGPDDCVGNKIQSCTLHFLDDQQDKAVEYVNCEFTYLTATQQNYTCVTSVGVNEDDVKQCFGSSLGDELQAEAEKKTGTIVMEFVPTIVLNDVYDAQVQAAAYADFKTYTCSLLEDENISACN